MERKYFNKKDYLLVGPDGTNLANRLVLKNIEISSKKITGTTFGAILGKNKYVNEFEAFCKIFKLDMPILNYKYIEAGKTIEPILREFVIKNTGFDIESYDKKDYPKFDYFYETNTRFGGLPDGYIKETNTLIEFKTTNWKSKKHWTKNGVPESYIKQTELYAYLKGANTFSIIVLFLEDQDYLEPKTINLNQRNIMVWNFTLNRKQVEKELEEAHDKKVLWCKNKYSPKFDVVQNKNLLYYLKCENEEQWQKLKKHWIVSGVMTPKPKKDS